MISDEINTEQIHDPMDEEIHDTIEEVVNSDREEAQRAIEAARTLTSLNTEETDENTLELPDEFKCPIGLDLMQDPVIAADGHSYEREKINQWFINSQRSPVTGTYLRDLNVFPNIGLRNQINGWLTQQGREELPQMAENLLTRNRAGRSFVLRNNIMVEERQISSRDARRNYRTRNNISRNTNRSIDRLARLVRTAVQRIGGNINPYEMGASVIRRLQELNCKEVYFLGYPQLSRPLGEALRSRRFVVDDVTIASPAPVYRVISGSLSHEQQVYQTGERLYGTGHFIYREYRPDPPGRIPWIWYENLDNNWANEMMQWDPRRGGSTAASLIEGIVREICTLSAISREAPFQALRRHFRPVNSQSVEREAANMSERGRTDEDNRRLRSSIDHELELSAREREVFERSHDDLPDNNRHEIYRRSRQTPEYHYRTPNNRQRTIPETFPNGNAIRHIGQQAIWRSLRNGTISWYRPRHVRTEVRPDSNVSETNDSDILRDLNSIVDRRGIGWLMNMCWEGGRLDVLREIRSNEENTAVNTEDGVEDSAEDSAEDNSGEVITSGEVTIPERIMNYENQLQELNRTFSELQSSVRNIQTDLIELYRNNNRRTEDNTNETDMDVSEV